MTLLLHELGHGLYLNLALVPQEIQLIEYIGRYVNVTCRNKCYKADLRKQILKIVHGLINTNVT